jgi:UDP-GlcNAc:undecaprenyl-phosphate GlcNAc-1-phosphate transferase
MIILVASLLVFLGIELLYFKIADHYNIVDKPNQRSSHTKLTIRGGGIIFPLAFIVGVFYFQPQNLLLAFAVLAISLISFLDDIITLSNKIRISVHLLAVILAIYQCYLSQPQLQHFVESHNNIILIGAGIASIILFIGTINACNFMDGINGISVLYFMVTLASIWYIQHSLILTLLLDEVWQMLMAALIVFGFFNLRKNAKTFAGDVGSISLALVICFLILSLMAITQNPKWILLLGVYGLDTVLTIFCRLKRGENIFEAHRSHFYQHLANQCKISHIIVSVLYAIVQLFINYLLVIEESGIYALSAFVVLFLFYSFLRLKMEGPKALFTDYKFEKL